MPSSLVGGNSPDTAALSLQNRFRGVVRDLSFTDAKKVLSKIDVTLPKGSNTHDARQLVLENIRKLYQRGLI